MASPEAIALDRLLTLIGQQSPSPWYPREYAQSSGVDRGQLDRALDELRLAGLIELTVWESGRGQGVRITDAGREVLSSPRQMNQLAGGDIPRVEFFRPSVRGEVPRVELVRSTARGYEAIEGERAFGRGEQVRKALTFSVAPYVTGVLMTLNVLVYVGGLWFDEREVALYRTGAVYGGWLLYGQWWRLFTSCFVHHGTMHLLVNMYALAILGPISERWWGRWRFLTIYLLAGFIGSCIAIALKPIGILAGASGCLWGVMASQVIWILVNRQYLPRELFTHWGRQLASVIFLNVVISFLPGISAVGHFAGGAGGALVAWLLNLHRFGRGLVRWVSLAAVALVPIVPIAVLLIAMDRSHEWHRLVKLHQARQHLNRLAREPSS